MHLSPLATILLVSTATTAAGVPRAPKPACDQATTALATGIHLNIVGQYAEFNGTQAIIQLETQSPGNYLEFLILKGQLESDIQAGLNIRLFNQQIAPKGNPAIAGLAQYAQAQETEKYLVANLTGFYGVDKKALDSLTSDIQTGIKLNQKNLASATSQCTLSVKFPNANQAGS